MQLSITGHHIEVTEALRNYVTDKFARLKRHFDQVLNVHVILEVEKLTQKAEATVQAITAAGGQAIFVKADVTRSSEVEAMVQTTIETGVDLLF